MLCVEYIGSERGVRKRGPKEESERGVQKRGPKEGSERGVRKRGPVVLWA